MIFFYSNFIVYREKIILLKDILKTIKNMLKQLFYNKKLLKNKTR